MPEATSKTCTCESKPPSSSLVESPENASECAAPSRPPMFALRTLSRGVLLSASLPSSDCREIKAKSGVGDLMEKLG